MPSGTDIDTALEAVVTAMRQHRALLASDATNAEQIWHAKVALNNASVLYDDVIRQVYDEETPWDCEYIPDDEADVDVPPPAIRESDTLMICIRHRRDYMVEQPAALLAMATAVRAEREGSAEPVRHLGQAIYTLIDAGDNTVAALDDVDELIPANGLLLINELKSDLVDAERASESAMRLGATDRLLYRLDESMENDEELVG